MTDFALHPQLAADTVTVADLPLSRLLLMNDSQYPWLILVPRRADVRDLDDLDEADSVQLNREIRQVSQALRSIAPVQKLNVASLGNVVPQLHVHVIGRSTDDAAWPRPVWGVVPALPYAVDALDSRVAQLAATLKENVQ